MGDSGLADVVVCNNYAHTVTRYLVETTGTVEVLDGEVLLAAELVIPDGVAVSRSGEWLAISNHETHEVLMYRYDEYLSPSSLPNGRLSGVNFPHSIRFVGNGSTIVVADAGLPYVHVFTSDDGRWSGDRRPTDSVRVMTDDAFHLGRYNMQEGGPKGIEVLDGSGVLAVTSTHQPLAFFDLRQVVGDFQADPTPPIDPARLAIRRALLARDRQQSLESAAHAAELADVTDAADRQRAELDSQVAELEQRCAEQRTRIDWLQLHIVQTDEAARRHRAEQDGVEMAIRQQLDAIRASTAWRLTAPLRRLKDVLVWRRSRGRRRPDDV